MVKQTTPSSGNTVAATGTSLPASGAVSGASGTSGTSGGEEVDFSKSLVLIVDDNAQNVELLQAYLETLGCDILTASDGLEAIKTVHDSAHRMPDLILLDVMMPRMSGFEVCRKLKDDPATRSIPIMMITALNELGDIERGVESGTDDFLTKPVNKLELVTRVKSLLRIRHFRRELEKTLAYIQRLEGEAAAPNPGPGSISTAGIQEHKSQPRRRSSSSSENNVNPPAYEDPE